MYQGIRLSHFDNLIDHKNYKMLGSYVELYGWLIFSVIFFPETYLEYFTEYQSEVRVYTTTQHPINLYLLLNFINFANYWILYCFFNENVNVFNWHVKLFGGYFHGAYIKIIEACKRWLWQQWRVVASQCGNSDELWRNAVWQQWRVVTLRSVATVTS